MKLIIMIDRVVVLKFIKFCFVGLNGMVIDFSITWLLKEKIRINKYIANSTGFVLAASSNYILNRFWTFQSKSSHIATEYFSFIFISIIGLALNNLILYFLTDRMKSNFYFSKLMAIGVVTFWNFAMNFLITFR